MDASDDLLGAYSRVDPRAFGDHAARFEAALPCLDALVTPREAALVHRQHALIRFVRGQVELAVASLAAAKSLDPDWSPPEALFPMGHPIRSLYAGASRSMATSEIGQRATGWFVDGYPSTVAPLERPFVLQATDEGGAVVWSGYVTSFTDVPDLTPPPPGVDDLVLFAGLRPVFHGVLGRQEGLDGALLDDEEAQVGAGLALDLEWWPNKWLGARVASRGVLGGEAHTGGPTAEAGAAALVGWHRRTADRVAGFYAHLGTHVETVTAWTLGESDPTYVLAGPAAGVAVDWRDADWRVVGTVEVRTPGLSLPLATTVEFQGGRRATETVALVGGLGWDRRALSLVAGDGGAAGLRRDDVVRIEVGVGIWR